jgi:ribonuclease-3
VYDVIAAVPDHDRWFTATVTLAGRVLGCGEGTSKKRAEQAAAEQACRHVDTAVS